MDSYTFSINVEGTWTPSVSKWIKNKLQIYFQSKNKSNGGDCIVNYDDTSSRATVYFKSENVRDEVLLRENHEITVKNETVKLRVSSSAENKEKGGSRLVGAASNALSDVTEGAQDATNSASSPGGEGAAKESPQSSSVVLEKVPENVSREMLVMLVESISQFEEDSFTMEVIIEKNTAVLTFNNHNDVDRFLTESKNNKKFQKYGLISRLLERSQSVRVENLTTAMPEEMLDLYFEKWGGPIKDITMIPEEQAAIVTFQSTEVVETLTKIDHRIAKVSVNVYPYYMSLGTALYGKDRPMWKMPDTFTVDIHPAIWKFLSMKSQVSSINRQMEAVFCHIDMNSPEVKLSPVPALLRQKRLTRKDVDEWKKRTYNTFIDIMAQYAVIEFEASTLVWKAVEDDVRSLVKEDALLAIDASRGALTMTGLAKDTKRLLEPVQLLVQRATSQIKRQRDGVSKELDVSPAMFYILQQEGLQKHVANEAPEMGLSYRDDTKKLVLSGLESEVYKIENWILQWKLGMSRKPLNLDPILLDFLRSVNSMDMSQDLFTSRGIRAAYTVDGEDVHLTGSSEGALVEAENRVKTALSIQWIMVEDQEVLRLPGWKDLNNKLVDAYNSLNKKTVMITLHPQNRNKIVVSGFPDPVKEVSNNLEDFLNKNSKVEEAVRVKSCAVVKFIQETKSQDWKGFTNVKIHFDQRKPKILLSGARFYVNMAKGGFQKMAAAFCTDELSIMKPGARKYFQEQGSMVLSFALKEHGCIVLLQEEYMLEEDEGDDYSEGGSFGSPYCEVTTPNGILVSASKADICKLSTDAVVNAANEDLAHIGGLALALLNAAGPRLQKLSDEYVKRNGKLKPGDAVVTDSCNLPCKYVVHAVGPRFSDFSQREAIQRLKQAVNKSLSEAEKVNCLSVAVPAVSSGIFGFPLDLCTETIAEAVREYCDHQRGMSSLTQIHLVDNSDKTVKALVIAIQKVFKDLHPKTSTPPGSAHWSGEQGRVSGYKGPSYEGQPSQGHWQRDSRGGGGKGNIQEEYSDVIVNTISEDLDLSKGAVSKAILEAAGSQIQTEARKEAHAGMLAFGDVVVTDGYNLHCLKVIHTVCPSWDNGKGTAERILRTIIRDCLNEVEKRRMASVSFPAIGTGNMGFPRDLVCRLFLQEVDEFRPNHLKEVSIVVHPSDTTTVDCFVREFKGQTQGTTWQSSQHAGHSQQPKPHVVQSKPSGSGIFGQVLSPSLGVYSMQMGHLTLEVSSGDITKEKSDVIVNSSNNNFNLKSGVSKAILEAAGLTVELECAQIASSPHFNEGMIMTSAGSLPSLGTGQGGVRPSAVADAMIDAVVDFVKKKAQFVRTVKILIFQTSMLADFHTSMKRRVGQEVDEKSLFTKIKDSFTSIFTGSTDEVNPSHSMGENFVLKGEEFDPTVFQLCGETSQAVSHARAWVEDLIVKEQTERSIKDPYINQLGQEDMEKIKAMQRELTISIRLEKGQNSQIYLEGLSRDVWTADSRIRDMIRAVERTESTKRLAFLEAFAKQLKVKIKINGDDYEADVVRKTASSIRKNKVIELFRKDLKDDTSVSLPSHWDDMKGSLLLVVPLLPTSNEYQDVEKKFVSTGLRHTIVEIARVQNEALWKSYQIKKKHLEEKNKHTNNEKQLFHGTDFNSISQINNQGYNRSYAGMHGAVIGKGVYFAVDPAYSASGYAPADAQGQKRMYLARVLVGDFTRGHANLVVPPAKSSANAAELFDSVTDNISNPTMFVVFNDVQAYPEFLITFK
ncbi:hypothetical protein UPYG_G00118530 [Umbra pygmaea]|uniref:Poly [ADP-ribose] polymerase n=1 Tax=Umbra pygmaea TaxID=75934 RepID=A0ABD0XLT2_UMBPY